MEEETRAFLLKILNTVSILLIWMITHVFIGIYKGYAFFEDIPGWANYLYYTFLLISFMVLVIYMRRKWKL